MSPGPATNPNDFQRLLTDARAGSSEALGQLWLACREYLMVVARQRIDGSLQGKVSPSDIVQETFLEAQRDLVRFQGDHKEELLAWLSRILINNVANVTRRFQGTEKRAVARELLVSPGKDGQSVGDLPRDTPTPSDRAIAREESAALEAALAQLPDNYREAIRLRYDKGLSYAQIGAELGCTAEAARKLWARDINQLEAILDIADDAERS
jgi:RNA polymerase sigma-70 factor (ECF subfamily)